MTATGAGRGPAVGQPRREVREWRASDQDPRYAQRPRRQRPRTTAGEAVRAEQVKRAGAEPAVDAINMDAVAEAAAAAAAARMQHSTPLSQATQTAGHEAAAWIRQVDEEIRAEVASRTAAAEAVQRRPPPAATRIESVEEQRRPVAGPNSAVESLESYLARSANGSQLTEQDRRIAEREYKEHERALAAYYAGKSQEQSTRAAPPSAAAPKTRMAGEMPMQNAAVREAIWSAASRVDNGPQVEFEGRNGNGYPKEKTIYAKVDGRRKPLISVPYAVEKRMDQARNSRFEDTRNPTRADVDLVANAFVERLREAGVPSDATLLQVPSSKAYRSGGEERMQPMKAVAERMAELGFGVVPEDNALLMRLSDAPTRTSIHETVSRSVDDKFDFFAEPYQVGGRIVPRHAGESDLRELLTEAGLGRNRTISEDYFSMRAPVPSAVGRNAVLMDDSVNQGTSQLAAALQVQNVGTRVTPITYWGFAGAPIRPQLDLRSSSSPLEIATMDREALQRAVALHERRGMEPVLERSEWIDRAEQLMRADPVGNWLGGFLRGDSAWDQGQTAEKLQRMGLDRGNALSVAQYVGGSIGLTDIPGGSLSGNYRWRNSFDEYGRGVEAAKRVRELLG